MRHHLHRFPGVGAPGNCRIFVFHVDDITIGIRLQVLFQICPAGQQGCPAFLLTKSDKPDTIEPLLCNIVAFLAERGDRAMELTR
ncbi:MAG: hypothetical protein ACLSUM_04910, partial [Dysosmobacter welbionis]